MHKHFFFLILVSFAMLLSACGSVEKFNPFSEPKPPEPYKPENATEYLCDGGKRLYVRMQENDNAVWLIYPEREVNLDKVSGSANKYSNGIAVLELAGSDATLTDGASAAYTGCKAVSKK